MADPADDSVGQWISVTFDHAVSLDTITVTPLAGSPQQPVITRVTISTDRGSVQRSLPPRDTPVRVKVPPGKSRTLKITIDAVRPPAQASADGIAAGAGIAEIRIPGVSFQQNMRIPNDEAASFTAATRNPPVIALSRSVPNANLALGSALSDDPDMSRTFTLPKAMATDVSGYAVPVPSPALEALLAFFTPPSALNPQLTASSWLGDLPRFRPQNLVGTPRTPWIAGLGDPHPSVTLTWNGSQTVDAVALTLTPDTSRPTEIAVSGATGTAQQLHVPPKGGVIHFAPIVGNTLRIQISAVRTEADPVPCVRFRNHPSGRPGIAQCPRASIWSQSQRRTCPSRSC